MSLQREDGDSTSGSSETKTDRYGFLLVNGDTNNVSSDDPCPELVRHREKKWLTLILQWDQVLEKKHNKIKAQCQKGIPGSVRTKCWPLLCGAKQRIENNKDLFKTLESSPGQQSWIDVIRRDTDRQFPFHEMFQSENSHGQQGLLKVLKAYTQFRPDEGYCQAQGPVAAVLLMNVPLEEAFWCLVQISELYLPGYYSPLLEGVLFDAAILFAVLKRTCSAAYKHMKKQGVEPLMFATDWLMCLYSRHLPFNTLLRVWDLFFCNGVRVLFQVAVVLVRRCLGEARQRKECEGQMETLESLRSVRGRVQNEQADAFIQEVCSVPLSLAELQRQTEKELEKWRKERPGSTFDPRDRCHGYHMIWEKAKEREKDNEKKERPSGHLSASLMRSHSSLSPAILRKKWRKRGIKTDTEEWEGRGLSKQDSDDEEKRRASVCGVAGELRAKTHKTPQEFSTHLQNDGNTITNTQSISGTEKQPSYDSPDHRGNVFEENKNNVTVPVIPQHTDSGEHEKEIRPSSQKKDELQTGKSQQEMENLHGTDARQDEENKVQTHEDDQREEISTHQDQPKAEAQQEDSQPSQIEDKENARNQLEAETAENRSKGEEATEFKTCKPEEEVLLNISTQEKELNTNQQQVELKVNTDTQEQEIEEEQENRTNGKHEEEMWIECIKQDEEAGTNRQEEVVYLDITVEEAIYENNKQEKEINTKRCVQEEEIQEEIEKTANNTKQEIKKQEEIKANISEQDLEIQMEKDIKANNHEQEEEIQEEPETKANSSKQEVELQEEKRTKANSSEEEVEIQEDKETKETSSTVEVEIQEQPETKGNSSKQEVEIQEEKETNGNSSTVEVEIQKEKETKGNSSTVEVEIQEEPETKGNSSKQEVEIQEEKDTKANSSEQEVEIQEEKDSKANSSEQEVEIQEEKDTKANSSEQEVEIQEENDTKANSSEQEVEIQEDKETKEPSSTVEVEIQEEPETKGNSSKQEVEIQDEDKQVNSDNEKETLKTCLIHKEDMLKDERQQQEASEQMNEVKQNLKMEEEMCLNVQTSECQEDTEEQAPSVKEEGNVKGECSTNEERTQQDQEGEREHSEESEKEAQISDAPGEETEGAVMAEENRSCTVDQEESGTAASSSCVQPETMMEHSVESETPLNTNQTQDENMEIKKTSTPEHEEPDRTSGSSNPNNKEEESEIATNITAASNRVKPVSSGSNPHPQLRLRRSSSSHTPYPTILSEDIFSAKRDSCSQTTTAEESDITHPTQTQRSKPEDPPKPQAQTLPPQSKSDKPKRKGLFHRLRTDPPSKSNIPKIVIQDFSEGEEKLSSKERRRRRRMQERKEKEEAKERKKLEKELEKGKERERKKPQTRGKSFQVLSRKHDDDHEVFSGRSGSQTLGRKRNVYSESYF